MPPVLAETERRGYALPLLPPPDHESPPPRQRRPRLRLTAFVRDWNARIVLRDGFDRIAKLAGGDEPTVLLYNPISG